MIINKPNFVKPALFSLLLIQFAAVSITARESIALTDLSAQGVSASASTIISDRLRNELFATGYFTVVERSQMDQILKEQGFQQSGCTSEACAVEVGQLLGVQYMTIGSVGLLGKTYTINVRLIDVATGQIIRTATQDCKCEIDDLLKKAVPEIARQLSQVVQQQAGGVSGKKTGARDTSARSSTLPDIKDNSSSPKPAKNRLVPRMLCGVVAAGGIGAGLYFNSVASREISDRTALRTAYENAGGTMDEATYIAQSETFRTNANAAVLNRTISYIIAGLGAVGFTLTFVF